MDSDKPPFYTGTFRNNDLDDWEEGTFTNEFGSKITGIFEKKQIKGQGKQDDSNGDEYVGYFVNWLKDTREWDKKKKEYV